MRRTKSKNEKLSHAELHFEGSGTRKECRNLIGTMWLKTLLAFQYLVMTCALHYKNILFISPNPPKPRWEDNASKISIMGIMVDLWYFLTQILESLEAELLYYPPSICDWEACPPKPFYSSSVEQIIDGHHACSVRATRWDDQAITVSCRERTSTGSVVSLDSCDQSTRQLRLSLLLAQGSNSAGICSTDGKPIWRRCCFMLGNRMQGHWPTASGERAYWRTVRTSVLNLSLVSL